MDVYVIKATGSKYRDCSLISAIYIILSEMRLGQSVVIDRVIAADGSIEQFQSVRAVLHRIKREDGIKVATKFNKATGTLKVIRINGLL